MFNLKQSQTIAYIYLIPGILLILPTIYVILLLESTVNTERDAIINNTQKNYQNQLIDAANKLSNYWKTIEDDSNLDSSLDPVNILSSTGADSVVIYDRLGKMIFPVLAKTKDYFSPKMTTSFSRASKWVQENNILLAINEYIYISENSTDHREQAIALYEAAVLLLKINKKSEALNKCNRLIYGDRYKLQKNNVGELILLNAKLLFLKLEPQGTLKYQDILNELIDILVSNKSQELLSSQHYFLSQELNKQHPETHFTLKNPEKLALDLLEKTKNPDRRNVLQKTLVKDLWQYTVNGRIVLLFTEHNLQQKMLALIGIANIPDKTMIGLISPGNESSDTIASMNAANRMPDWKISLNFIEPNYMSSLINERVKVYRTTIILVIAFSLTLGLLFIRDMRRRLRLADLKNDLVANVTHELKTPLASTRLLLDTLISRKDIPADKLTSYLQHLSTENSRLCRLVEHFLAFTKLGENQYSFQIIDTCLDELIEALNEAIKGRFPTQRHLIRTKCVDEDIHFTGDIQSLVTVLLNLLENALKFSDECKDVYLDISRNDKKLLFSVKDDGVGLSRHNQKMIFKRFYQADERLSRNHGGCGLGLSIVKSVLTVHGSKIQVESVQGEGSCFSFDIVIKTKATT